MRATAIAHPNIAFIKYWGNRDPRLRLPLTGSISMNLAALETRTNVEFDADRNADAFILNGRPASGECLTRVSRFLDRVREKAERQLYAQVESVNSYPSGAGIASSAAGFAALALAASRALGLEWDEAQLSRLARLGSGSACRSIPSGFVEWLPGSGDLDSYAVQLAPADHWDLIDLVALVNPEHKAVGSSAGHNLAETSPLNPLRVAGVPARLELCRQAILQRDFDLLARVTEEDYQWMHAVMRTSSPPLLYWTADTEVVIWHVQSWRQQGHALCVTVDAGPNPHVIALAEEREWALTALRALPGVMDVLVSPVGNGAQLVQAD